MRELAKLSEIDSTSQEESLDARIEQLSMIAADAAMNKKALDPVIIDVRGKASYAGFLVVCTGRNDRHVTAIADSVQDEMKPYAENLGREGLSKGHWVLLDFGDIIVHVFHAHTRYVYDIERLWSDAPRLPLQVPDELKGDAALYEGYDIND